MLLLCISETAYQLQLFKLLCNTFYMDFCIKAIIVRLSVCLSVCLSACLPVCNHFWITQAELHLKRIFVNASFIFFIIFLDIYENPKRKNFFKPSCPNHPKIINWNKKWHELLFLHFFVVPQEGIFHPLFWTGTKRVKTVFLLNSKLMPSLLPKR